MEKSILYISRVHFILGHRGERSGVAVGLHLPSHPGRPHNQFLRLLTDIQQEERLSTANEVVELILSSDAFLKQVPRFQVWKKKKVEERRDVSTFQLCGASEALSD